jgi:hypothetical protein
VALGYEGWAKLNINGTEDLVLCTGASVPLSRIRLDSSSGYGGQIKTPVTEIGIGSPHTYDWSNFDGSVNFEVHESIITNQLKPWILDRQKAGIITTQSRYAANNMHAECFWNSISLNTSSQSLVEGSIGFVAVDTGTYVQGGGYTANKTGNGYLCNPGSLGIPDPLTANIAIPFWKTFVTIDTVNIPFLSWNLDYSQDIVKFFACENNANPVQPKFLAAGPMTVNFTGEYMMVQTPLTPAWTVPNYLTTLYITLGSLQMKTKRGELTSSKDDVVGGDSPVPISVEYALYEVES